MQRTATEKRVSENGRGATYWVTGLPGAGKTSIGKLLWQRLRSDGRFALFLDGDRLRGLLGDQFGFSRTDRLALAKRYALFCQELSNQGAEVICATVSMFEDVRRWNRGNLPNYREIYLRVPLEVLRERDQKGLYSAAASMTAYNVPGINQPFEEPRDPHIVIDNDGSSAPEEIAESLFRTCALPLMPGKTTQPFSSRALQKDTRRQHSPGFDDTSKQAFAAKHEA